MGKLGPVRRNDRRSWTALGRCVALKNARHGPDAAPASRGIFQPGVSEGRHETLRNEVPNTWEPLGNRRQPRFHLRRGIIGLSVALMIFTSSYNEIGTFMPALPSLCERALKSSPNEARLR